MDSVFQKRLKSAMIKRNKTQADLCRETGIISAAMSSYYNGKYEPKPENGELIAKALNVSYSWLMGYDDNPKPTASRTAIEAGVGTNLGPIRIPVLSEIAAGIPIEAMENHIDDNDPNTWEEIPKEWTIGGKEYFALQVSGNSMEPQIPNGSIAIIEKCYEWHSGKIMAVYINGYNATLKRVHVKSGGIIVLEAFNSEYETKVYTADEVESIPVRPCGVLIETRKKW